MSLGPAVGAVDNVVDDGLRYPVLFGQPSLATWERSLLPSPWLAAGRPGDISRADVIDLCGGQDRFVDGSMAYGVTGVVPVCISTPPELKAAAQ